MKICNLCAKNSEQVKKISENNSTSGSNVIKIQYLLQIFQNDIVQFLLDNKESLICHNCLQQLKKCYEFVQKIKASEKKFVQAKEIKTEHDYIESLTGNVTNNETTNAKVTVHEKSNNENVFKTNLKFKLILPKTCSSKEIVNKNIETLVIENKTRLYKCLRCAESFKSFKQLKQHEVEFCENNILKDLQICVYCHKCFSKEISLSDHITQKHPQQEFLCCLCQDKCFAAKGYLARHIKKVHDHEILQYFCGECPELMCLSTPQELQEHFLCKHPCQSSSNAMEHQTQATLNDDDMDLEMHEEFLDEFLLAHTNENAFQFSECWEALDLHLPDMLQTTTTSNLNNVSEFTEAFGCPKCFEQFKNPQPLLKHLAEFHNLPVLICRKCQKCFPSFKDFKRHKLQTCLNTTLPLNVECPYCRKTFNNSANLKQHIRIVHSQLKRHICQLCDKQFSTLDHLKKHVLSQHQNERKHLCAVCDKRFTQLGHLKQHLAIHTTGKTLKCSECSLKFWRKIDLERHRQKNHHVQCGK
ncbi:PR domain zinc finger protein 4-like [Lucilia cuprina]|uniref:PR domain zinc finger protein 4-like n=1 Tax=Lucilia cuprina TaxID=7375 RepID=UPI001F059247|nr:PR domain zinc finger protein 4-like [Lucilia cuprina]XP_023305085.2 PR domain zinc finger protein 4-like [Lucilia cuprina]